MYIYRVTTLKLENISLKGLDTLTINRLDFNLCNLSNDIDIVLNILEVSANYVLEAVYNNDIITGNGSLV